MPSLKGHTNRGVHWLFSPLLSTIVMEGCTPHWLGCTHLLFCKSITVPDGHSQPCQQLASQLVMLLTLSHVRGQDEPQVVYTWPSMGQAVWKRNSVKYHIMYLGSFTAKTMQKSFG